MTSASLTASSVRSPVATLQRHATVGARLPLAQAGPVLDLDRRPAIDTPTLATKSASASSPTPARIKVGVVGAGIIAQVMHLHYMRELADHFDVVASVRHRTGERRRQRRRLCIPKVFTDWREMLHEPIDMVLILTSGSHAPIAIEAAKAGKHVLVEKPMCFSVGEGKEMRRRGRPARCGLDGRRTRSDTTRHSNDSATKSPASRIQVAAGDDVRGTVPAVCPPLPARARRAGPRGGDRAMAGGNSREHHTAIGEADEFLRKTYHYVLVDSLVHELNTVRGGAWGSLTDSTTSTCSRSSLTAMLRFGGLPGRIHWLDLPGFTNYKMEFACYGPDKRVTLNFPSPFLRSAPTMLEVEGGDNGSARSWRTEEITSYDSAFKAELLAFHDCVVTAGRPLTDADDALHDIAMCQAIIRSFQTGPRSTSRAASHEETSMNGGSGRRRRLRDHGQGAQLWLPRRADALRPSGAAGGGRDLRQGRCSGRARRRAYEIPAWTTDWRTIVDDPTIDIVDICTPPGTHAEIAIAAAAAGKGDPVREAARCFVFRAQRGGGRGGHGRCTQRGRLQLPPATGLALMQRMISDGMVGDVLLWRANWMSDEFADPDHTVRLALRSLNGWHLHCRPRLPPVRHGVVDGR